MEQATLHRLLDDPKRIEECSTVSLEQLVARYPWVPTFQLLLTKKYQLAGHDAFDTQLQKTALVAVDRQRLFTLINEPPHGIAREPAEDEQPNFERVKDEKPEDNTQQETNADHSNHQYNDTGKEQEESATGPAIPMEEAEAYHQFMKEFGIIQESSEKKPAQRSNNKGDQQNPQDEASQGVANQEEEKPEHTTFHSDEHGTGQIAEDEKAPRSFTEWLALFKTQHTQAQTEEHREEGQPHSDQDIEEETARQQKDTGSQEEIPQAEMEQVSEQAEKSVEQSDEAVSQTLARIYESQKKYVQAISIYEKLRLKYPEKSSYFVDKINELKKNL